ncbi:hexameric tyrosine-coordinated heme protein [Sediminicurvatus halobius]|uniref:Peroxidase n=1 Tax=Sediminicurvatus halobius TaxID=2182432 RepID=A0A2U2MVY5_9GAMM|nr:hexameric tyrosine-coordinated heme protein [Spiribacter halobius]PWG60946.1 hypothetical protein DEM34_18950 [Spiribacter halobius]UEX76615.1 hexameric tyrosine-coordinated heme protein [Spiribacter halobius]
MDTSNRYRHPAVLALHAVVAATLLALTPLGTVFAQDDSLSLITETPAEGFELAVTLSQRGVATTQTDPEVRKSLRGAYAQDADSLINVSQVIAIHFQTIAAANDYWRED